MQRMLDDGISTRRGVMNAHREAGLSRGHLARRGLAGARASARTGHAIVLPLFHQMTADEQDRVVASLERRRSRLTSHDAPILTPAFNESENLAALYARLVGGARRAWALDWEWMVVDDHSRDDTFAVVERLTRRRPARARRPAVRATPARTSRSPAACTTRAATPR